jgi:putative hydrolase of the HAD superfamily
LNRAVLFDAAGTLIELVEPVGETYARHAANQGLVISAWRLTDAFARAFPQTPLPVTPHTDAPERRELERDWWRGVVRRTFLAADSERRAPDFDTLFAELWDAYSSAALWRARSGALELLERLRKDGLRTAVVSNFDSRLGGLLAELGFESRLDAVVLGSDAGAAKPAPEIFRFALERLRVAAEHAVFVGNDPERDLAGARAAGLRVIDVTTLATLTELQLPEGKA